MSVEHGMYGEQCPGDSGKGETLADILESGEWPSVQEVADLNGIADWGDTLERNPDGTVKAIAIGADPETHPQS